jgi:UDP-N-acetylmuramate--alanine ligase
VTIGVPGRHNVLNALGALAAAVVSGVAPGEAIGRLAAACAELPKRRFEIVAQVGGARVIVDYAHHPEEIRALIAQARGCAGGAITAVFQPHRYTRTLALRDAFPPAFDGADRVILMPVYAASEQPLAGGSAEDLYAAFRRLRPAMRVPTRMPISMKGISIANAIRRSQSMSPPPRNTRARIEVEKITMLESVARIARGSVMRRAR